MGRELEITPGTKDHGKTAVAEYMGEPKSREEMASDSLLKVLNDLEKG